MPKKFDNIAQGKMALNGGECEKALVLFQSALLDDPDDAMVYLWQGHVFIHLGRYEEAVASIDRCLELDVDDKACAYLQKGCALEHLGKDNEAIDNFISSINSDKEYFDAYMQMGHIFYKNKNYIKALENFTAAIKCKTDSSDAWFWYGNVEFTLEAFDIALGAFNKALDLGYNTHDAQLGICLSEQRLHDIRSTEMSNNSFDVVGEVFGGVGEEEA